MAKLVFLLVLAFAAYVAAYPSPQDLIQSLPGRVKRAPGPNPDPRHIHHYEKTTRDRFGNTVYTHEDVIHPDRYDSHGDGHYGHGHFGHGHFGHDDYDYGHHDHGYHRHGSLGGFLNIFG